MTTAPHRTTPSGGVADTRRFVTDPGGRVLGEYGVSATDVKAEFIWMAPEVGDSGPFGGDDGLGGYMPIAVATATATPGVTTLSWVHSDHLGTPIVMTDATGTAIAQPTGYTTPAFPGQSKTLPDLYYNRYRDYDPTAGRYIQADPIGLAGGSNPYLYAMGNPVRYTDPTGELAWLIAPVLLGGGNLAYQYFWEGKEFKCIDLWEVGGWTASGLPIGGAVRFLGIKKSVEITMGLVRLANSPLPQGPVPTPTIQPPSIPRPPPNLPRPENTIPKNPPIGRPRVDARPK